MEYKILITTSGTGSRLKEETRFLNKSLLDIAGRPAIEYILDLYPEDIPLVVTLGYRAEQIRNFFATRHPKRIVEFVEVDPYEGDGSSLAYSMLRTESLLQYPFIFHACDTLITGSIPTPRENWIAGFRSTDATHYRTLNVRDNKVIEIVDKGARDFSLIHIGLIGIHEYELFWDALKKAYQHNPSDETLNDTSALSIMLKKQISFNVVEVDTWFDTGNPPALDSTRAFYLNVK